MNNSFKMKHYSVTNKSITRSRPGYSPNLWLVEKSQLVYDRWQRCRCERADHVGSPISRVVSLVALKNKQLLENFDTAICPNGWQVRAEAAVRALLRTLTLFIGYHERYRTSIRVLIINVYLQFRVDQGEKFLKNFFAEIGALAMEKRKNSSVAWIVDGPLLRAIKRLAAKAAHGNRRSMVFIRSIMESKRSWHEMSELLEISSMNKHKQRMSQNINSSSEALEWVRKAVNIVVPPMLYKPGGCVPTYKSTTTHSCRQGGAHSAESIDWDLALGEAGKLDLAARTQERVSLERYWSRKTSLDCPEVHYQSLPEPGKYRIITKGPGDLYTGLRGLQAFLLKRWKVQPYSTMVDYLDERYKIRFEEGITDYEEDSYYLSGDYDAATDNMHIDATLTCLDQIIKNLGLEGSLVAQSALHSFIRNTIVYPDGERLRQTNGQLMGHPLSFPILCIINLSTYMRATNKSLKTDIIMSPLLINGDDILFRGRTEDHCKWESASHEVGLIVNPLKTYASKHYGLINSRMYHKGDLLGYVNIALAEAHCVKSDSTVMVKTAPATWDELTTAIPADVSIHARAMFLKTLECKIPKIGSFRPNYFLPKWLGGIGLTNYSGRPFGISYEQRKLATYLWRNPQEAWLIEKIGSVPYGCAKALEAFRKIRPNLEKAQRTVIGPLRRLQDWETVSEDYLSLCLRTRAYVKVTEASRNSLNDSLGSALYKQIVRKEVFKWHEPPMMIKTIREAAKMKPRFQIAGINAEFSSVENELVSIQCELESTRPSVPCRNTAASATLVAIL